MSFELTSERLQDIAVGCVTKFMNKQASLSEAIAKEAMDLELNPDQTKRVIEASNTIAYLRQLEKSADRTFEFEVADYTKVMTNMCMPEDMAKQAGLPPWLAKKEGGDKEEEKSDDKNSKDEKSESKDDDKKEEKSDDKDSKDEKSKDEDKDDEEDKDEDSDEDKQEKRAMLRQGYFHAKGELDRMNYDEPVLYMDLVKAAGLVGKDPHGFEKLAFVVEQSALNKVTRLCGLEKQATEDLVFREAELSEVRSLQVLLKQAEEFVQKKAQLEDFTNRAEQVLFHKTANVEKLAFIGTIAGRVAGLVGKGLGKAVSTVAVGVGRKASQMGANIVGTENSFKGAAKAKGFSNVDDAVKHYDQLRTTHGVDHATKFFNGQKPNVLAHRIGLTGVGTALTGLGVTHKNNVNDLT